MPGAVILLDQFSRPIQRTTERQPAVRARFDAAQTNNENSRYYANADYLGPNAELDPGTRRRLRSRSRYECANNTYAAGMIRTLANDTIGTGPGLQVTEPGIPKADVVTVENRFWEWCQASRLPQKLRTMRQAKARDGESFGQLRTNPRLNSPVKLDLLVIEADLVASAVVDFQAGGLLDGLIIDDFGNVIAYRVLREHPGENVTVYTGAADLVSSRNVLHLFNEDRPGQRRGCPEITPALPLYAQLRRYTLAVIRAAESAAIPSWIIQTQGSPQDVAEVDPLDTVDTERGMGLTLPAGWGMNQLKAEHPTSTYGEFKREILNEIARCLNMPFNIAAGNSSSYNYSSGRLDHRTYYKQIRVERSYFELTALDSIFAKWWEEARLVPGLLPDRFASSRVPPIHEWRWDGDEHVDPTKEADATETRLRIGITSYVDEVSKLGGDVDVIHQKNAETLGLTIAEYRERLADSLFGTKATAAAAPDQGNSDSSSDSPANQNGDPNAQ